MSEQDQVTSKSLLGTLSATAAVLGAFIAAGTAGSQAIQGYFQYKIALKKADQDLELNQRQSDSTLAETYLKMILSKDTNDSDKRMLLGALSELKNHPLQKWAEQRATVLDSQLGDLAKARQAQVAAVAEQDEALSEIHDVQAQIAQDTAKLQISMADVAEGDRLNKDLVELAKRLVTLNGKVGKIQYQVNKTTVIATASSGTDTTKAESTAINLEIKLTPITVKAAFPKAPEENLQANLPFVLAAIKEFQIFDPRLVAAVFATIRAESETFAPISEGTSKFNTREKPFDLYDAGTAIGARLGNTEPGDGERFKGRGYVLLTGRANYVRMSQRLGLESLITDNPDLANSPTVAAKILCAFVATASPALLQALKDDDIVRAAKLIDGGLGRSQLFSETYKAILANL